MTPPEALTMATKCPWLSGPCGRLPFGGGGPDEEPIPLYLDR